MGDDVVTIRCACGWESTGSETEAVEATIEHGRRLHNMVATPEQVLAQAVGRVPRPAGPATTDQPAEPVAPEPVPADQA
jgi:hypothetical protein